MNWHDKLKKIRKEKRLKIHIAARPSSSFDYLRCVVWSKLECSNSLKKKTFK